MKHASILFITMSLGLSGCSSLSWFEKEEQNPETPQLLDNSNAEQEWYCYGKKDGSDWQCDNQANDSLITAVTPKRRALSSNNSLSGSTSISANNSLSSQNSLSGNTSPSANNNLSANTQNTSPADAPAQAALITNSAEFKPLAEQILEAPAEHYAVQILALQEENGLVNYAKRNGIAEPLYVKIRSREKDWYVLLLGIYSDRLAAHKAKSDWEKAKALKAKPWVRQIGPLQEAIRSASGS